MRRVSKIVLDASALLAVFQAEPGWESVAAVLPTSIISSVNASEAITCLIRLGFSLEKASNVVSDSVAEIASFDAEHASIAAVLKVKNKNLGLSFGDCACLALGQQLGLPIYTADEVWGKIESGLKITIIR